MPWTPPPGGVEEEQRYTPRSGVRYGTSFRTGRKRSWPRSIAPPLMSPPTRLRLCASSSAGPARGARGSGRGNPGAKRSTCDSIALGHVDRRAVRDVAVRPRRVLARRSARGVEQARAARAGRTAARPAAAPGARSEADDLLEACRRGERSPARAHSGARHGIGPSSAQSSLNAPGPWRYGAAGFGTRRGSRSPQIRSELARRDVGAARRRPAARRRRRSTTCDSPPSSPQARGERVREPLRAAARKRPADRVAQRQQREAEAARSAGARAAASSAQRGRRTSARARSLGEEALREGPRRRERAQRRDEPARRRAARTSSARRGDAGSGPISTCSTRARRGERPDEPPVGSPVRARAARRSPRRSRSSKRRCRRRTGARPRAGGCTHSTSRSSARKNGDARAERMDRRADVVHEARQRQLAPSACRRRAWPRPREPRPRGRPARARSRREAVRARADHDGALQPRSVRSAGPSDCPPRARARTGRRAARSARAPPRIPKSRGRTFSRSSSHRSGVETGAPGFGRTE